MPMISTNVDKGVDNRSLLEQEYELENHMRKSGIDKFIFQNLNFFDFSWHIIWLVRRAVSIFFYWRKDLG